MGYSVRTTQYRYTVWVSFSSLIKKPNWKKVLAEELYNHSIDSEENKNLAYLQKYETIKSELRKNLIKDY